MCNRFTQFESIKLMLYNALTAPAGYTASQVCFAITIGIKQLRNFRISKLADIGDFLGVSRLLVNEVALRATRNVITCAREFFVTASLLIEGLV